MKITNGDAEFLRLRECAVKSERKPRLLLHACCAPCSSYVLTQLTEAFETTVYFYNPNIYPVEEFDLRLDELKRLAKQMGDTFKVVAGEYVPEEFFRAVKGLEDCPEGGDRCEVCFKLRLSAARDYAAQHGFDFFGTTLTVSPHKNAALINQVGLDAAAEDSPAFLVSDFKKRDGYKKSVELSKKYSLYRQDYCGCIFSKK